MEQYQLSNLNHFLIICASAALHLCVIFLFFNQSIANLYQPYIPVTPNAEDIFVVKQILSTGDRPSVTILFQDEIIEPAQPSSAHYGDLAAAQESASASTIAENSPIKEKFIAYGDDDTTVITKKAPASASATESNEQEVAVTDSANGFIKSAEQDAGRNSGTHDAKQLALQIYATKVWNSIKKTFLAHESYLHLKQPVNIQAELLVTINRSGTLTNVQLIYPTEKAELQTIEQLLINRAKQTALFPPFPELIEEQIKKFSFPLSIQGEAGFHSYALRCK